MDKRILQRVADRIDRSADFPPSLPLDKWLASSLMQKAVRRGDSASAVNAALTYLAIDPASFWRRIPVIAFEDVGAGSPDAVIDTVAGAGDRGWRKAVGGDQIVARFLVDQLARSPKERSADFLICAAKHHPGFERMRQECGQVPVARRLMIMADGARTLGERTVAAWYSSGLNWRGENRLGRGDLPGLMNIYRDHGVSPDLIQATIEAAAMTREPLTVLVPLIWLSARDGKLDAGAPMPPAAGECGIPLYALDKHTRIGREAIAALVKGSSALRRTLEEHVADYRHRDAVEMAAFYVDAAPVSRRLWWPDCERIEAIGLESDMLSVGVPREGAGPILAAVRENLDQLNFFRRNVLRRYLAAPPISRLWA